MSAEDIESSDISSTSRNSQRFVVLSYEHVRKVDEVMEEIMLIHGHGNFPTLEVKPKELVKVVRSRLEEESVSIVDIRLNGSAANHVLTPGISPYNDLDIIFSVDLSTPKNFDRVRNAVLHSLLEFLPEGVVRTRISAYSLIDAYVHKMVKVTTGGDRWSLISLGNEHGRNVEFKFVDVIKRQFEFSVDSFQILLDSFLLFDICSSSMNSTFTMSENFYPTVVGESLYGNFREALYHLQNKLIATRQPEEIRGGGLLKYCSLLLRGYRLARPEEIMTLGRYMCSRFFIDFNDIRLQRIRLNKYLANHFIGDEHRKYEYLLILHKVVDESTGYRIGPERWQFLSLIEELAGTIYYQEQQQQQQQQLDTHFSYFSSSTFIIYYHDQLDESQSDIFHQNQLVPQSQMLFGGSFFYTSYAATYNAYPSCDCMTCTWPP